MNGVAGSFAEGGIFMYFVLLLGFGVLLLTIIQLILRNKTDMSPVLWGLLAALVLTGGLGTALGVGEAFRALSYAAPDHRSAMMAAGISMALNTTTLALILALPLSVLIGVASFLTKRSLGRRLVDGDRS
ncbi:MAG: MotA/TolQ/ExbB proton channel family protein [Polyangia bacterium]